MTEEVGKLDNVLGLGQILLCKEMAEGMAMRFLLRISGLDSVVFEYLIEAPLREDATGPVAVEQWQSDINVPTFQPPLQVLYKLVREIDCAVLLALAPGICLAQGQVYRTR